MILRVAKIRKNLFIAELGAEFQYIKTALDFGKKKKKKKHADNDAPRRFGDRSGGDGFFFYFFTVRSVRAAMN